MKLTRDEESAVARGEMGAEVAALEDSELTVDRERLLYRELFDATPFALCVVDRAGLVRATNRAADALFDADGASLRGRALCAFVASSDTVALRAVLGARVGSLELSFERARGATFRARLDASPIENGDGALVSVVRVEPKDDRTNDAAQLARALRDKEDLLQRERAIRGRLERTDNAKDRFIAILSHDLRGPINAVLGWTRLLRTEHLPEDTRARAFETIERNMHHQLALVEELLDLSRIAADRIHLELREIDLRACVRQVVESTLPVALDASVNLEAELDDDDPAPVFADHIRLLQIVTNLLSNAIKFARGGNVRVRVRSEGAHAVLEVEDDGRGIDPAVLSRLFDCFRQGVDAETSRAGLGLGLYIVRRLVELHGGTIEAASEGPGKGARFTARFPLAPEKTEPGGTGAIACEESTADLDPLRVLVVDDDPDSRDLLATVFAARGATVAVAESTARAVAMFDTCMPDVVVSDLDMPGDDGFTLIRRIRSRAGDVPAIAVSGLASEKDAERAYAAGYDAHLAKPFDARELLDRVRELSSRRPR